MDVRAALTNFVAFAGEQTFGSDGASLEQAPIFDRAVHQLEALAAGGTDRAEIERFVNAEFFSPSESPFGIDIESKARELLISQVSTALRGVEELTSGRFNPTVRIDTSTTSVSGPSEPATPEIVAALELFARVSPGDQGSGYTRLERSGQPLPGAADTIASGLEDLADNPSVFTATPDEQDLAFAQWVSNVVNSSSVTPPEEAVAELIETVFPQFRERCDRNAAGAQLLMPGARLADQPLTSIPSEPPR